jgi:hypothetical protein
MEPTRLTKTSRFPRPLGVVTTFGLLIALVGIVQLAAASTAVAAHPRPTPSPTPTASPSPSPTPPPPSPWSIVQSPNPDPYANRLSAIAAVSGTDVWAVGSAGANPLAEHWNGSTWSVVPTPIPAGTGVQAQLLGVAAITSTDVWAVGFSASPSTDYATLAEHWNGTAWSIVVTPNPAGQPTVSLNAVAAITSSDVWAAGGNPTDQRNYAGKAVLEHWNGSSWSLVAAPQNTATWFDSSRFGVAAVASNDVWAIGSFDSFHWDGAAWSVVQGASSTSGASASGAAGVWAVGSYRDNSYGYSATYTTAYVFNGSTWTASASLSPTGGDTFQGVSTRAATDVWAVGSSGASTLTEHWDGIAWSVVPSRNGSLASNSYNFLDAVVAIGSNDVWAVGYYFDAAGHQVNLTEHYGG